MVVSGIGLKRGATEDTVDTEDRKLERRTSISGSFRQFLQAPEKDPACDVLGPSAARLRPVSYRGSTFPPCPPWLDT